MKKIFLFPFFGVGLLVSCVSKPLVIEGMVEKEQITDNLFVFPVLRTSDQKALARYDFLNHKLDELAILSSDMTLEDVSSDKDIFLLKDKMESRITVFSVEQGKVLFQKQFDSSRNRIGAVRISPDKSAFAFAWRPKNSDVEDDIVIIRFFEGTTQNVPAVKKSEVSDLFWSTDGGAIFTATYDNKDRKTHWVKTDAKFLSRQSDIGEPKVYFHPYHSREINRCKFRLDVTVENSGSTKNVRSIDKVESGKRTPILRVTSGIESYPHGSNYHLWSTSSCGIALLRVNEVLYALDLENRRIAAISNAFAGTADGIPAKTKK